MLNLSQITPTPTPTDVELIQQAGRVIDIWNSLTPLMGVLFLAVLSLVAILVVIYFNRGSSATAITVLSKISDRQDREIEALKEQTRVDQAKFIASITVIGEQATRSNDLWEASNNQSGHRVAQQQRLVDTQAQIATDLKAIVTSGSAPVQEIKFKVDEIKTIVTNIDKRTADWPGILEIITPLLTELGVLRQEAKKHSTQPLPPIELPPNTPEAKPV